jgi:radical SAM protein with 4Fe4S-binding SPASM domain
MTLSRGVALACSLPPVAVLEMTWRCNHNCLFCGCPWYADGHDFDTASELSTGEWCRVVAEVVGRGVTQIAFTGGECLLKPGLKDIISHASMQTCCRSPTETGVPDISVLSNGRALTEGWLVFLKEVNARLSLSLPGLDDLPELVGADTTADEILHWIGRAKNHGLRTNAAITVTRRNLDTVYETIAEALLAGADTVLLNRFLPGGRGLKHRDLELSAEETVGMLDTAEAVLRRAGRFGSIGTEIPACVVGDVSRFTHLKVSTTCGAAKGFFVIGPDGGVRVCNHSPVVCGSVLDIDAVLDSDYWRRFVDRDYLPEGCRACEKATRCDGGCREAAHVVGGAVDANDVVIDQTDHSMASGSYLARLEAGGRRRQ